jgi:polyisoprenoid-binding protein YceI
MKWIIDPVHSSVEFAIVHMAIARTRGRFKQLRGDIETNDGGSLQAVNLMIEAESIDTGDFRRDAHLTSPDFLDAERYPTLMFQSTRVEALGDGRYQVCGDFTIRDRTRPIVLEVVTTSPVEDVEGGRRAGARAEARLSRAEWGIDWNYPLLSGGLLVGDTLWFTVDVEAVASTPTSGRQR